MDPFDEPTFSSKQEQIDCFERQLEGIIFLLNRNRNRLFDLIKKGKLFLAPDVNNSLHDYTQIFISGMIAYSHPSVRGRLKYDFCLMYYSSMQGNRQDLDTVKAIGDKMHELVRKYNDIIDPPIRIY